MTRELAATTRTIALVGASPKPERPSYGVMRFLLDRGFDVTPVNPGLAGQQIHGRTVVGSLAELEGPIDMVDIFRNTEAAGGVIDEAIVLKERLGIRTIWCQLGVMPYEAAQRAEAAGLRVVMNHCPAIDWR